MAGEILVATSTSLVQVDGKQTIIAAGRTTVRAGHPMLEQYGHLFEPLTVDFDLDDTDADVAAKVDAKAVRQWAADEGIDVPTRGKLPADVVERYRAAHGG